jgi:prolyl 4-hydroxylase
MSAYEEAAALLSGRGVAMDPTRGAALAEKAARGGDAACALLLANLAAAGFGRGQSWSTALDWLARAAELGSEDALDQLALLAGKQSDVAAMRAAVDVEAWTKARPIQMLVARPRVGGVKGFLDRPLCEWLVKRAGPLQAAARVYNPATGQPMQHDVRSNTTAQFTILDLDLPMLLVRRRIAETMGVPVLHLERCSIFRYEPGQRFTRHVDFLDPNQAQYGPQIAQYGQRVLTFLIYLNEGFEGGETTFLLIGRKFKGGLGDAVFFHNVDETGAPDQLTVHEGSPPASGQKWLLSQFIRNRPQQPG